MHSSVASGKKDFFIYKKRKNNGQPNAASVGKANVAEKPGKRLFRRFTDRTHLF
jgi:hypothetical protein